MFSLTGGAQGALPSSRAAQGSAAVPGRRRLQHQTKSTAADRLQVGDTRNSPCQAGGLWRGDKTSSAGQGWTRTHLYGWTPSFCKLYFVQKNTAHWTPPHPPLCHCRSDTTNSIHPILCLTNITPVSLLMRLLTSWVAFPCPHHHDPWILHKDLFIYFSSPQLHEKEQKALQVTNSSTVDISKPSVGIDSNFAEPTWPPSMVRNRGR